MKEAIVAAVLVLVAAGCVPQTHTSSSTTATTTSHAQAVRAWAELTNTHMEDMGIAVGEASQAIASQDYAGLAADCHQAHDAAEALEGPPQVAGRFHYDGVVARQILQFDAEGASWSSVL